MGRRRVVLADELAQPPVCLVGSSSYESYQPGYRYGFESANRYCDREWNDVESDLRNDWNSYEHRGSSTWEQVKDAVRDAWDRVTGHRTDRRAQVTSRRAEPSGSRPPWVPTTTSSLS